MNLSRLNQPKQPWSPFKHATVVFLMFYCAGNLVGLVLMAAYGTLGDSTMERSFMIATGVGALSLIPSVITYYRHKRRSSTPPSGR